MTRTVLHQYFVRFLIASMLFLVVMHLVIKYRIVVLGIEQWRVGIRGIKTIDFVHWFNLDTEERLGAIFSTLLIFFAASCFIYAAAKSRSHIAMKAGWLFVAAVLVFMGIDEYFMIHEFAGRYFGVKSQFGINAIPGWVQVMGVVVALLLIPMGLFWWYLPGWLKWRTAISAIVFLGGAMGMETAGSTVISYTHPNIGMNYHVLAAVEEGMEMLGIIILIDAMLLHLAAARAGGPAASHRPSSEHKADVLGDQVVSG